MRNPAPDTSESIDEHRWLLVSDVDGTLTGDDAALRRFITTVSGMKDLLVALNSSRPLASQDGTLAALDTVFQPTAMIGAMGTEIRVDGEPLEAWTAGFGEWDRSAVDRVMAELGFEPHDAEFQTPYKASFTVPGERNWKRATEALREAGLAVQVLGSGESDFDVLPPNAGKERATRFLAEHLGVGLDHLMVAGDSGNDLDMFRASRKGIVVGNARAELRDAVDPAGVYFAQRFYAAGVLEGLAHWGAAPATRESASRG